MVENSEGYLSCQLHQSHDESGNAKISFLLN